MKIAKYQEIMDKWPKFLVHVMMMMMEMIDDYESEVDFQFHFSIVKIYFL